MRKPRTDSTARGFLQYILPIESGVGIPEGFLEAVAGTYSNFFFHFKTFTTTRTNSTNNEIYPAPITVCCHHDSFFFT